MGITSLQHLSGGKAKLSSIGKYVKNSTLRSQRVVGAMSAGPCSENSRCYAHSRHRVQGGKYPHLKNLTIKCRIKDKNQRIKSVCNLELRART